MQAQRGRAWAIFAVANLGFVLSMFYRVSISVIAPQVAHDLSLDAEGLSNLTAAFFYAFAACQIPLGLILDRWGPRWPMAGLSALGAAAAIWFALATSAHDALLSRALLGVGMSCGLMGPFALYAIWFPPSRFATICGVHMAGGALGQMLAATPLALMSETLGWRGSYEVFAAINVVQALAVMVVVRDHPQGYIRPARQMGNPLKGLGQLLRMPAYWGISLGTFCRFGAFMSLQGLWAGPFVIYGLGLDTVVAGNVLLVLSVSYMISLPLSGRLSDHVGTRKWVIAPTLLAFTAIMLVMGFWREGWSELWLYAVFALVGLTNGPGQIMYAHIKELVPPAYTSTAMTGINLYTMLGPAAVMQITGLILAGEPQGLHGAGAFAPAWFFMFGILLVAGVIYCFLPDTRAPQPLLKDKA